MKLRRLVVSLFSVAALLSLPLVAHAAEPAGAEPALGTAADAALASRISQVLGAEQTLAGARIAVEAHDGVVYLRGKARSEVEVQRAVQLAAGVEGVKDVKSEVQVN